MKKREKLCYNVQVILGIIALFCALLFKTPFFRGLFRGLKMRRIKGYVSSFINAFCVDDITNYIKEVQGMPTFNQLVRKRQTGQNFQSAAPAFLLRSLNTL